MKYFDFQKAGILCAAAACLLLGACGFALRGSAELSPELQTLTLESSAGDGELARLMRRTLASSGVTVLDQAEEGVYRLQLGDEQGIERVLSVNYNARAGEYELSLSVPFQLGLGNQALLGPEILVIERVYLADPENAVAKAEEAQLIQAEMRRELTRQVMRRLESFTP